MHFVEKVQVQGTRQRKIPLPRKFWRELPLGSMVKIELVKNNSLFYVDFVQAQGKVQRKIPLPQKFWEIFPLGSIVHVELMKKSKRK